MFVGIVATAQPAAPPLAPPEQRELSSSASQSASEDSIPKPIPYAWRTIEPLGERYRVPLDTLLHNFYQTDISNAESLSFSTLGTMGSAGFNNIYFEREEDDLFFFKDGFSYWMRGPRNFEWYNTRLPYTQLSYHTGSSGDTGQDNLSGTFSGNVNKQLEVGGGVELVTAKGQYLNQANKQFSYRLFGSYIGERYEIQAAFNNYNYVTQENGGIVDDNYILDPAALQGGDSKVNPRSIPTNLTAAFSRLRGNDLYITHRYNLGYYQDKPMSENDTIPEEEFVPVSSIVHTLKFSSSMHRFVNESVAEDTTFFANTYLSDKGTNEKSEYWALTNTVGMTVHEGLSKYFPMGLGAYLTYEVRQYDQVSDTLAPGQQIAPHLAIHPDYSIAARTTQHALWVGGQLWQRNNPWLSYQADVHLGLIGPVLGDLDVSGYVGTKIPLWNDTLSIKANAFFKNTEPQLFYEQYVSNHFMWKNDFGKVRRLRVGGEVKFPKTGTYLQAGFENIQNHLYFDKNCLPQQESGNIQVISATLRQDIKAGIFHLDLAGTYQFTSHSSVLPLPEFSLYGNLYLLFPVVKVMNIQVGIDCNWYSSFKAPAYQPALLVRHNQDEIEIGNYPFINAYVNVKLKKARFYVMYTHLNQGWLGGNNYFSIPHYPLNPAMLQLGVSVDFAN